ncbi:MAG: hypothetical protein AAF720_00765 [Pseudomonadota bacterium]
MRRVKSYLLAPFDVLAVAAINATVRACEQFRDARWNLMAMEASYAKSKQKGSEPGIGPDLKALLSAE